MNTPLPPRAPAPLVRRRILETCAGSLLMAMTPLGAALAQSATNANATPEPYADLLADRLRFGWLGRSDVQEFIYDVSGRNALPRTWVENQFRGLGAQPRALSLINPPPPAPGEPPRKKSWARYLAAHADAARVREGREFLSQHRSVFKEVEKRSGVPAEVIAAIIGVETKYGKFTGRFPVLETLATLAFDSPRRSDFFRKELETLLLLGHQGVLNLKEVRGSFAGAMGLPQFMPSSIKNFAIGYRRKERPDLLNSPHDAIASVGNYLKIHGWIPNAPSHAVAATPTPSQAGSFVAPSLAPAHTVAAIESAGIAQAEARLAPETRASLIDLPEEDDTVQYWFAAHNFFVITQYNRSFMYAAAVLTLAESLVGPNAAGG